MCWGVIKNEVARNCDFTMDNLKFQLENAVEKVTAKTGQKVIEKVRNTADMFWKEEAKLDKKQENFLL